MRSLVYLDHHAASPLCSEARRAIRRALDEAWANPASPHAAGRRSAALLEHARRQVASAIGARHHDVVWTSGGTEACNSGVLGLRRGIRGLVSTAVEHPAVLAALERVHREEGVPWVRLPVRAGVPPQDAVVQEALQALRPALLAVQWVNHETGHRWPVERWAELARRSGARVFVDATQALGKLPVDVAQLDVDALALASPKVGGPAGVGALWLNPAAPFEPLLLGGEQERGRRAGAPDVLAAVGFGAACETIPRRLQRMPGIERLRDALEAELLARGGRLNGAQGRGARVATATNVSFRGWEGHWLVAALDIEGVCIAAGPACSSGKAEPSPTVEAMHPEEPWRAKAATRWSLGPETTQQEVALALEALDRVFARERGGRP